MSILNYSNSCSSDSESESESESLPYKELALKLNLFEEEGPYTKDMFISLCIESYKKKLHFEMDDTLAEVINKFTLDELIKLKTLTRREQRYYEKTSSRTIAKVINCCACDMKREQIEVFKELVEPRRMLLQLAKYSNIDLDTYFAIRDLIRKPKFTVTEL